ncbi:MAG: hypothetical protein Ct9H300mP1_30380 [Planctomycetaceae bacterium]|nr:MAG: hypothetical protein Ct9H300mP1_30380 [Planctomycetaceae bacterium]
MATDQITIYHNPRCSKSRPTLSILEDAGITPRIIDTLRILPRRLNSRSLASTRSRTVWFIRSKEPPTPRLILRAQSGLKANCWAPWPRETHSD